MYNSLQLLTIARPLLNKSLNAANSTNAQHLESLLWATLPGVDVVDFRKTSFTLLFYYSIFCNVPFAPAPISVDGAETENEAEARRATTMFKEWSIVFLEKITTLISHLEGHDEEDFVNNSYSSLLQSVLDAFFGTVSFDVFQPCLASIYSFIKDTYTDNTKCTAALLSSVCASFPKETLELFFPLFSSRLVDGEGKALPQSAAHRDWNLYMLSQLLNAPVGDHLCAYISPVKKILSAYISHSSLGTRGKANKILRNVLKSICHVSVDDPRPFSVDTETDPSWDHWKNWFSHGTVEGIDKTKFRWHVPNDNDVRIATEFIEWAVSEFVSPVEIIIQEAATSGKPIPLDIATSDKVIVALQVASNIARGADLLLGDFNDGPCQVANTLYDEDEELVLSSTPFVEGGLGDGSHVPFARRHFQLANTLPSLTHSSGLSYRSYLTQFGHRVFTSVEGITEVPVNLITSAIELSSRLLLSMTALASKGASARHRLNLTRQWLLEDPLLGRVPSQRSILRVQVNSRLASRLAFFHRFNYTPAVDAVVDDLLHHSISAYAKVAATAISVFRSLKRACFPVRGKVIDFGRKVLADTTSSKENVSGALSLLAAIPSGWSRLRSMILTVCRDGQAHTDDVVQVALNDFFVNSLAKLSPEPLHIASISNGEIFSSTPTPSIVTSDVVTQRNKVIQEINRGREAQYKQLINELVALLQSGANSAESISNDPTSESDDTQKQQLHWRYELMCLSVILSLTNPEVEPTDALLGVVCDRLSSEVSFIRTTALSILVKLLLHSGCGDGADPAEYVSLPTVGGDGGEEIAQSVLDALAAFDPVESSTSGGNTQPLKSGSLLVENTWSGWNGPLYCRRMGELVDVEAEPSYSRLSVSKLEIIKATLFGARIGAILKNADESAKDAQLESRGESTPSANESMITKITNGLVFNHPTLHPDADMISRGQGAGQKLFSVMQKGEKSVVSYGLFPYVRLRRTSKAFSLSHVRFVHTLFDAFPLEALEAIACEIAERSKRHDKHDEQCTSAELFAGAVCGSRSRSPTFQRRAFEVLWPSVSDALRRSDRSCMAEWWDALTLCFHRADPRRPIISSIIRELHTLCFSFGVEEPEWNVQLLSKHASTSADQMKYLLYLSSAVSSFGWRIPVYVERVLNLVRNGNLLISPYDQVRKGAVPLTCFIGSAFLTSRQTGAGSGVPASYLSFVETTILVCGCFFFVCFHLQSSLNLCFISCLFCFPLFPECVCVLLSASILIPQPPTSTWHCSTLLLLYRIATLLRTWSSASTSPW